MVWGWKSEKETKGDEGMGGRVLLSDFKETFLLAVKFVT